jgi:predicted DNA-binding transcriptional regulator YafY
MDVARLVRLHTLLRNRRGPISAAALQERLECSRATLYRTAGHLRDQLGAPLLTAPGAGFFYDRSKGEFELPGFWLAAEEIHALLAMDALLSQIEPGVLREHVAPLRRRIDEILARSGPRGAVSARSVRERVAVVPHHRRVTRPDAFVTVASATLRGRRLTGRYHARYNDRDSERELSPWRLLYYRDNWYLEAFCHRAGAPRMFALDRFRGVCEAAADAVPRPADDAAGARGYGIFLRAASRRARLRFSPERARWVADEHWHPAQQGQFGLDGSYELTVPYGDDRELIGEILRHGRHVTVLGPPSLAAAVRAELRAALAQGGDGAP